MVDGSSTFGNKAGAARPADAEIVVVSSHTKFRTKPLILEDEQESDVEPDLDASEIGSMVERFRARDGVVPVLKESGGATAPSYQQVKDGVSESALVLERGSGRYFGVEDDSDRMICRHCGGDGHKAAECSVVICNNCGQRNSHSTRDCTKSKKCAKCGQIGHLRKDCTQHEIRLYCELCHSRTHTNDTCLTLWRSYIVRKNPATQYPATVCCYNCGHGGHYGDDCYEPRRVPLRFAEDSAFAGKVLPQRHQHEYFERVAKDRRVYEAGRRRVPEAGASRRDRRAVGREREKEARKQRAAAGSGYNGARREGAAGAGSWKNGRDTQSRFHGNRNGGNYQEYQRYAGYSNKKRHGYSMEY